MPLNQLSPFAAAPSPASGASPSSTGADLLASGGQAAPDSLAGAASAPGGTGAPEAGEGMSREELKRTNQKAGALLTQFMGLPEEQKPLLYPQFLRHAKENLGLDVSRFPQQYDPRAVDLLYAEIVGIAEYVEWVEKREREHTVKVQTAKGPILVKPTGPYMDALLMGLEAGSPEFKDYTKKRPGPLPR